MNPHERDYEVACERLLEAAADEVPDAVGNVFKAAWILVAQDEEDGLPWTTAGMDGPTPGHAVFRLALHASLDARAPLIAAAHDLARRGESPDGRVLSAIAHATNDARRKRAVQDAVDAFYGAGAPGARMHLVGLVELTEDPTARDAWLSDAFAAAAAAPNPQLLGDLARGVERFEPRSVMPSSSQAAAALWERAGALTEVACQRVRVRLAAMLPAPRRAPAVAQVLLDIGARWPEAPAEAGEDLAVIAPALDMQQVTQAVGWRGPLPPLIRRAAALGLAEEAVEWLSQLSEPSSRAATAVSIAPMLPVSLRPAVVERILAHLASTTPRRAAWFCQDHGAALVAATPFELLDPIITGLPTRERVVAMGAVAPHLSAEQRRDTLSRALREASTLAPPIDFAFVGSAEWLPADERRRVFIALVDALDTRKELLLGADGDSTTYPGLVGLAGLIAAMGGDTALEAVVKVVIDRTCGDDG